MSLLSSTDSTAQQLIVDLQQVYTLFDTCINDGTTNAITNDKLHHMLLTHTGVNYSDVQIQDIIDSIDTNNTGDIQFTEFLVTINKIINTDTINKSRPNTAVNNIRRPKTSRQIESSQIDLYHSVFNTIDSDNDGYIDINELKLLYENNGVELSDSEIAGIAYMCDVNGNGKISYSAFEKLLIDTQ